MSTDQDDARARVQERLARYQENLSETQKKELMDLEKRGQEYKAARLTEGLHYDYRQALRDWRKARKIQGLCYECIEPAALGHSWCEGHLKRKRERINRINHALRQQIFDHYGWECMCCKENFPEFLTIDHIFEDGAAHRKRKKATNSTPIYKDIISAGFPASYQTLCFQCNRAKSLYGVCPHQRNRHTTK